MSTVPPGNPDQPGRPPAWLRIAARLIVLPLGLIIALVLLSYALSTGNYVPWEFLFVILALFIGLFVVRLAWWRSRRRYRELYMREYEPVRVLRERYAKGEITREQFDAAIRFLHEKREE